MKCLILLSLLHALTIDSYGQKLLNAFGPSGIDTDAVNSLVLLETALPPKEGIGTGFLVEISADLVVLFTANHVLQDIGLVNIHLPVNERANCSGIQWVGNKKWHCLGETMFSTFSVQDFNLYPAMDVAILLNFDVPPSSHARPFPINRVLQRDQVEIGQRVYFLGFPFNLGTPLAKETIGRSNKLSPILSTAVVSGIWNDQTDILMDGISNHGNSGGPIFSYDSSGKAYLTGMLSGGILFHKLKDLFPFHFVGHTPAVGVLISEMTTLIED